MSVLLSTGLLLAQSCTGPFCGPDDLFERPGEGFLGTSAAPVAALAADGALLVAWELRSDGQPDIAFNRRGPGANGQWLDVPRRLDTDDWGAARSLEPRVAAAGDDRAWVLWQDDRDGAFDLRLSRSTDGGFTWDDADRRVGGGVDGAVRSLASMAANESGELVVAWEDLRSGARDLWMTRSSDGGETWEPERRVDSDPEGAGVSYHPQVVTWDDGTALVVWWDERDGLADVYVRRTDASGGDWIGPEMRLDPGEPGEANSHGVAMARYRDTVSLAWEETSGALAGKVVSRMSTDRGATWTPVMPGGRGESPVTIARPSGSSIVAWAQPPGRGSGQKTSIGGRIREILLPTECSVATAGGMVRKLFALEGSLSWWSGAAGTRAFLARGGELSGRAVVDVVWIDLNDDMATPRSAAQLHFGEPLLQSAADVRAQSLAGAVTPEGVLHLVWVNRWGDAGELAYRRLQPGS